MAGVHRSPPKSREPGRTSGVPGAGWWASTSIAAASQNPIIDEFHLMGDDQRWPIADGVVDLAVSDWVLEHVQDPALFVAELTRVLRPGGVFLARTVSRHSPLSIGARMVPNRAHSRVLKVLQPTRLEKDVFATAYRMNTRPALHALLRSRLRVGGGITNRPRPVPQTMAEVGWFRRRG